MKRRYAFVFVGIVIGFTQHVTAQGMGTMIDEGWGAAVNLQAGDRATRIGIDMGFLNHPAVEMGLKLFRQDTNDLSFTAKSFGPYVSIFPLRQSSYFPVTFGLHSSLNFLFFSGSAFDNFKTGGNDMAANEWYAYASIGHSLIINTQFSISPAFPVR